MHALTPPPPPISHPPGPRLPHEVPLRMVGVGMGLPTSLEAGGAVDRYLGKLKDAALHMRMLHAQFHYDTRLAVSRADVEAAWGRCGAGGWALGGGQRGAGG